MAEQRRIGFLGAGAMGQALAGGLLAAGHPREALAAADAAPERREQIADVARRHGVSILEDDTYGFLPPDAPPPLATYAPSRPSPKAS